MREPKSELKISFVDLISPEMMRAEVLSTYLTIGQSDDQVKTLLADKARIESEINRLQTEKTLSYISVGSSFEPDGRSRALELGIGFRLPVSPYPAKALELSRRKILSESDAKEASDRRQREMKRLSTKIINRLASMVSDEVSQAEAKMKKVHHAISETYGSSSLMALKSQLALAKYRLEREKSFDSLYKDYLAFNVLTGRLRADGFPLLRK